MGTTVTASGMEVEAVSGGALLISANAEGTWGSTVDLSSTNKAGGNIINPITYADGWKYPGQLDAVDKDNGTFADELTALNVDGDGKYYKDYVVYLASDIDMEIQELTATVTFDGITETSNDTLVATTVAFVWSGTNTNKTDIADPAHDITPTKTINAETAVLEKNNVVVLATSGTIPSSEKGSVAVIMRVYFDGALMFDSDSKDGDDTCYVRSSKINTSEVGITVQFDATPKATA